MLRALIYGLAILHLGPVCQKDTVGAFRVLSLVFWLMLSAGAVALLALKRRAAGAGGHTQRADA